MNLLEQSGQKTTLRAGDLVRFDTSMGTISFIREGSLLQMIGTPPNNGKADHLLINRFGIRESETVEFIQLIAICTNMDFNVHSKDVMWIIYELCPHPL